VKPTRARRNILIAAGMTIVFAAGACHLVSELPGMAQTKLCTGWNGWASPNLSPSAQGMGMRLILRILGTWLIGLALVLLVVDGTKSLGANELVYTSLAELWMQVHPASLDAVAGFFESRFFADLLDAALKAVLDYPAFAVFGLPGIMLALAGRAPRRERFLRQDQI
jgi:hypothetical protein